MEKGRAFNCAVVCIGAIVGAGFASGREIMSFFSRFGAYSWLGIVIASAVMGFLCLFVMGVSGECGAESLLTICKMRMGKFSVVGEIAFTLLLCATGGSMLCAAGELAALTLPVHHAYTMGLVCTFALGLFLISKDIKALAVVGKMLLPLLVVAFVLCYFIKGDPMPDSFQLQTLLGPVSYGAMNIALCAPVLAEIGKGGDKAMQKRVALYVGLMLLFLLALGNGALWAKGDLADHPLPMVKLLGQYGIFGFYLCAAMMYAAVFSTLLSCLRGLYQLNRWSVAGVLLVALIGFERLIGTVYPLLGYGCVFLMVCWRRNCSGKGV